MNKADLIEALALQPHIEGGYFARTYESAVKTITSQEQSSRPLMTSIYYMLTDESRIGYFHRNQSDIVHYFHSGAPLDYLIISPQGLLKKTTLGPDLAAGQALQLIVHGGYWKATVLQHGEYGLLSEAVAPGFDYADMELATPALFKTRFPHLWEEVSAYVKV